MCLIIALKPVFYKKGIAMNQIELPFIERMENNVVISQNALDGYINATSMCDAAGKKLSHYLENASTKAFIGELSSDTGIPASQLIQSVEVVFPSSKGLGFILRLQYT